MPASHISTNNVVMNNFSQQQVAPRSGSNLTRGEFAHRVSNDLYAGQRNACSFRELPPVLSVLPTSPLMRKTLSTEQFNILNKITDSAELKEYVCEHLSNHAKEKNITLNPGSKPELKTVSSFDSNEATNVYFSQPGKNSNGDSVHVSLSIGNAQLRQMTPEVMGILAKSFNMDSSILKQLRSELKEANSQLKSANDEKLKLQENNSQLNKKAEDLQAKLDTLKRGKADSEKRLGELLDIAARGKEVETELKGLGTKYAKLNEDIAQYEAEITQCKTELSSTQKNLEETKRDLQENKQKLIKLGNEHQQQLTEINDAHDKKIMTLQKRAEIAESGFESQKGDIRDQAQHLLKLGKRSYWPTALAGVATAVALVFMGIKAAGLSSAEDDLKDADNDANYEKQGNDAGEAAVSAKVDEDRKEYTNAKAEGREEDAKAIADRYTTGTTGEPLFSSTELSDSGKTAMESVRTDGYNQGVKEAKTEAIDKAKNTVAQAKEAVGMLGGAAGLSLLLTGGFFTYARSKNKHLAATEKSINQALNEGTTFKAPEERGFLKFTSRFVSGKRTPSAELQTSQ